MRFCTAAIAALLTATPAPAQTLTMGVAVDTTSLDPHYHNIQFNHSIDEHIFDPLTYQDASGRVIPWLAESWTQPDPLTWEFTLREGVTFTDGTRLDPDDVPFSFQRVSAIPSPSPLTHSIETVSGYERISDRTFRLKTGSFYPYLPLDLAAVPILSRSVHKDATTGDFNTGKAVIGTGAYRLVRYGRGDVIELARNPAWWGPRQPWEHVVLRPITNDAARLAALLSGGVDLIDRVLPDDLPRLRNDPALSVSTIPALQVLYLFPDQTRDTLPLTFDRSGAPLARNPTKDARVRQAISLALNRQAIADTVMQGAATPAEQMVAPGAVGRDDSLTVEKFDIARARALLAEAGLPDGWRWTLAAPKGMYQNDDKVAQVIAQMLTRIGIETKVEVFLPANFYTRINAKEFPIFMTGYLNANAVVTLRSLAMSKESGPGNGALNRMDYRNPAFDTAFSRAAKEQDDARRGLALAGAMRMVMEDHALIPVIYTANNWVTRKDRVVYTPGVLGFTQAMWARPPR